MKKPNYKLYFRLKMIEGISVMLLMFLMLIALIGTIIYVNYSTYLLLSNDKTVVTVVISITCFALLLLVYYILRKIGSLSQFSEYASIKKVKYSIVLLVISIMALISMQYICYLYNMHKFDITQDLYQIEMNNEMAHIEKAIKYNQKYINKYSEILIKIDSLAKYGYTENDENFYIALQTDTIMLRPLAKPRTSVVTHINIRNNRYWLKDNRYYGVGILFPGEDYNITHPESREILKSIQNKDSVSSNDLIYLFKEKIEYYSDRLEKTETSKMQRKLMGLSFTNYWINSLINNGDLKTSNSHLLVKLISFIQVLLTAFASGYIFKHLYKVLDKE